MTATLCRVSIVSESGDFGQALTKLLQNFAHLNFYRYTNTS
ncbi:hypothetical protein ROG8370_03853 [Roseovarius gaetbuli]|uniref:Uncharacterized protein n=1 Tax=Roseovarius gaetbuli TaxID=1356575 RepID=A0A1X7ACF9_9RHOB|nr:hypothetical protein ROG8370_03853 [Roseovarius gaetbuli]